MRKKGRKNIKYSAEYKISVIMDMLNNHLGYCETVRKYWGVTTSLEISNYRSRLRLWERIYFEEGVAGFYVEKRGRTRKVENSKIGRPRKRSLDETVEKDLIAENQRLKDRNEWLEMECEYLKKLDALVRADEQKSNKKRK